MGLVMQLFDYQNEAIDKCRVFMRGDAKWIIIDAPAGAGKTEVAMAIVKAVAAKGKMCEFICDRQNLVNQTSERFFAAGIDHGVLMGKIPSVSICRFEYLLRKPSNLVGCYVLS